MIEIINLREQKRRIGKQIEVAIGRVLDHGKFILGPEVSELEERLSDYTGAKHCITCANGTDALQIALMVIGVSRGDEVIVPSFSYISTAEAAALLGANVVFCDIELDTYRLNLEHLQSLITDKTKAIVPVSLYGQPENLEKIQKIARKNNIAVIEDAAQSFGSSIDGKKSCNLSDIACTSFFPSKPLGCFGDGGAIFTSDSDLANRLRKIARHGQTQRYHHEIVGVNSRLDTIQAAVLIEKLSILDDEIYARNKVADFYEATLCEIPGLSLPRRAENCVSALAQYTLRVDNRNKVQEALMNNGIQTAVHYPIALHQQPALLSPRTRAPNSEIAAKTVLSIPINAYLKKSELSHVAQALKEIFSSHEGD